ncbi:phosphatidylserine decarboxylase [Umezawaea beigongshangensis]|uniref:phosphatidylserine decarboxylase n=1 Tax=Umezawaea beigongshangensis TaxID=2780383 RepID=UPI0018F10D7B|nr:phosphatidylserine decarboxylase [Umezawaea beigongshangensis]
MTSDKPSGAASHFLELARSVVPPMHPAGRPFVAGAAAATLLLRRLSPKLGVVGGLVTAWVAWFFREPKRVTPTRPNVAVAPADGTVSHVVEVPAPAELGLGDEPMVRISVFLSVFDVHVQRVPVDGEVRQVSYHPGKFLSADLDKASEENERNTVLVRTPSGRDVVVVQIAGLIARRIVCDVVEGEKVGAGQTYGLIRFGSRVDLYVPRGSRPLVEAGQRTVGGETVLAELPED